MSFFEDPFPFNELPPDPGDGWVLEADKSRYGPDVGGSWEFYVNDAGEKKRVVISEDGSINTTYYDAQGNQVQDIIQLSDGHTLTLNDKGGILVVAADGRIVDLPDKAAVLEADARMTDDDRRRALGRWAFDDSNRLIDPE